MRIDSLDIGGEDIVVLELSAKEAVALATMAFYHEDGKYNQYVNGLKVAAVVFYDPLISAGIPTREKAMPLKDRSKGF